MILQNHSVTPCSLELNLSQCLKLSLSACLSQSLFYKSLFCYLKPSLLYSSLHCCLKSSPLSVSLHHRFTQTSAIVLNSHCFLFHVACFSLCSNFSLFHLSAASCKRDKGCRALKYAIALYSDLSCCLKPRFSSQLPPLLLHSSFCCCLKPPLFPSVYLISHSHVIATGVGQLPSLLLLILTLWNPDFVMRHYKSSKQVCAMIAFLLR